MSDEVEISGISGRFPESDNLDEFWQNLINGVDMVTIRAGRPHPDGVPLRKGILKADLAAFDHAFFGIHTKQAEKLDPQIRVLHEVVFEAIMDAGVNPTTLRGSNTGVFVGVTGAQTHCVSVRSNEHTSPYDLTGNLGSMAANRISYAFDFKGPSYTVDTLCSSSMLALHIGLRSVKSGECDGAVVAGINTIFQAGFTLQVQKAGALSPDGKCKSYDADANGYVRSEAIVAIFIQRKSDALRSYATLLHSKTNSDGFTPNGISAPSEADRRTLMKQVYEEAGVDPGKVFYVEGHGTGTQAGDLAELTAISSVFLKDRCSNEPLLIGSVKSNMGHPEAASGLCSVAKVILSLENQMIPANLHFSRPNPNVPAFLNGKIRVVNQNTSLDATRQKLVGLDSSGFGGSNVHVILRGNDRIEEKAVINPELIPFSGTTEHSVRCALEKINSTKRDAGFESLLQSIHQIPITGHKFRGYTITGDESDSNNSGVNVHVVQDISLKPPPLWYIFSGMGTVYKGMFADLMSIKPFAESVQRCNKILEPFGLNVLEISAHEDESEINRHMGILFYTMQTSLVDTLDALGLKPDGMIGHSAGELVCAYADKCLTQEQVLLIAHHKDVCVLSISGCSMAAVGLTWEEAVEKCPQEIYPACHNGERSVTLAGPLESMSKFVEELSSLGLFARLVDTGGVAYHSPHLAPILPAYEAGVRSILVKGATALVKPKLRSPGWISTCIPHGKDGEAEFQSVSVEYLMANIKDPVKFHNAVKMIPEDAVIFEISAHALFLSLLRKAAPGASVLGLIRKDQGNARVQLLSAIGQIYLIGYNPNLQSLAIKPAQFPVPTGTRMIAPLIKWDHSSTFELMDYNYATGGETKLDISLDKNEYSYLRGHKLDSRIFFPVCGYLQLVWTKFASGLGQTPETTRVEFTDLIFENALILQEGKSSALEVSIMSKNGGAFQISTSGGGLLVSGIINSSLTGVETYSWQAHEVESSVSNTELLKDDIYKLTRLIGYEYDGVFKGIESTDLDRGLGKITWNCNWTSFLDTMIQLRLFCEDPESLKVSTSIQRITINPAVFLENAGITENLVNVTYSKYLGVVECPGIKIHNVQTSCLDRITDKVKPVVEALRFVPYFDDNSAILSLEDAIKYFVDIVIENTTQFQLQIEENVELLRNALSPLVLKFVKLQPLRSASIVINCIEDPNSAESDVVFPDEIKLTRSVFGASKGINLLITHKRPYLEEREVSHNVEFILWHQTGTCVKTKAPNGYIPISKNVSFGKQFVLYRKIFEIEMTNPPIFVPVQNTNLEWIPKLQKILLEASTEPGVSRIYVVSSDKYSGLVGFINCLKLESGGENVRCIFLPTGNESGIDWSTSSKLIDVIYQSDLVMNIFNETGQNGSYRHFPLVEKSMFPVTNAHLDLEKHGNLSTLNYYEASTFPGTSNINFCRVHYSALNFRDVLIATAKLPCESAVPLKFTANNYLLGMEFSGIDSNNERVMGMVKSQGLATQVCLDPRFSWKIPEGWSLEDGATVPVAYSTAYYALVVRGNIQQGESIFILSGSSCIGQAAISIALRMSCIVYTSVATNEERLFLLEIFTLLQPQNVTTSRELSFEQQIMTHTNGKGVDLVLNSLAVKTLHSSLICLAEGGRFIQIGPQDLSHDHNLQLGPEIFSRNASFHMILLDLLLIHLQKIDEVHQLVLEGINSGVVTPFQRTVFQKNETKAAFKLMASEMHIGKVLFHIKSDGDSEIEAIGRTYFNPEKIYIIVGGLGGFGFELVKWMISRGCRKLILVSRSCKIKNMYMQWTIRNWKKAGLFIKIQQFDLCTSDGTGQCMQVALKHGSIGGIFNLAMVLRDKKFKNQTEKYFADVLKPKWHITLNLDRYSRQNCPEMEYFVVFSSFSAGRGTFGQTNYGFANSAMERICETRRRDGLAGLAIEWGAIGDVGVVFEHMGGNDVEVHGLKPQRLASCLNVLDNLLRRSREIGPVVTSWTGSESATLKSKLADTPKSRKSGNPGIIPILLRIMGLNEPPTNTKLRLIDHGLDSLMAAEAKLAIESYFGKIMSVDNVREFSWDELAEMEKSK